MKFKADEIASVLQSEIQQYQSHIDVREVGRVLEVGDGIARVYGLSGVMAGEMVEFPNGITGLAINLEENSVGVIILGDYLAIEEGDEVRSTGRLLSVPVGDAVIGRVLDPLGNPLDGKGPLVTTERRLVESNAPGDCRSTAGAGTVADGAQGNRCHDPHRPRSTRVDHRRPQNGQNRDRHRRHHQSARQRREVFLCRHWPEGFVGGQYDRSTAEAWRDGFHHRHPGRRQLPRLRCSMWLRMPAPPWPSTLCTMASTP